MMPRAPDIRGSLAGLVKGGIFQVTSLLISLTYLWVSYTVPQL